MNQKLGSKDGKNNRRLFFLNRKRKLNIQKQQTEEKEKKEEISKKEKDEQILNIHNLENQKNDINQSNNIDFKIDLSNNTIKKKNKETSKDIEKKLDISPTPKNNIIDANQKEKESIEVKQPNIKNTQQTLKPIEDKDYLEKQIIKILDEQIDENRYQLKKIDSEIHTIEKEIDSLNNEEDVEEFEKEIEILIEKLNRIKTYIDSIQKTFDFDFPVEDPDNYLIYLVDEYKDKRKNEIELSNKLKEKKEFKSIIDKIIEIEEKHELLLTKTKEKKEKLNLDNDEVKKMNNNIIDIEDMKKKIEKMLEVQTKLLEEIKTKVDETVHITEKVDYITKRVNHSLFELFLLMSILKHNLSIKNSVIAAVSAKLALDMILKMTTPTEEKIITKVSDVKDYKNLINSCLTNTNKLEDIMNENLNSISSIRYNFEYDYKECSYLPSYQEVMDKLNTLEDEMKERKKDIIKMKNEVELQLEKNNAKVKKYGSIIA